MAKLVAIVLTAAVCLPLGALLQRDASADRRKNSLPVHHGTHPIDGHRHLWRAQAALHEARAAIEESQRSNEALWSDTTGRAAATKDAIEAATRAADTTAEWVRAGVALSGQGVPYRRLIQRTP